MSTGEAVGLVTKVTGETAVVRGDGSREALEAGDRLYVGDVLETGDDSAIGVVMADESTLAMGSNGRIALDAMVFDPGSGAGQQVIALDVGILVFVSGYIAKADPGAMVIKTSAATIGVRGTQLGVHGDADGSVRVTMMVETDGFVGEVVVRTPSRSVVLNRAHDSVEIAGPGASPGQVETLPQANVVVEHGGALKSLPLWYARENDYGLQGEALYDGTTGLEDFETLAGLETAAGEDDPLFPDDPILVTSGIYTPADRDPLAGLAELFPAPFPAPPAGPPAGGSGSDDREEDEQSILDGDPGDGAGGGADDGGDDGQDDPGDDPGDDPRIAVFPGPYRDYRIGVENGGVTRVLGPGGQLAVLVGVERLRFDDAELPVSVIGHPPEISVDPPPAGNEDEPIPVAISVTIRNPLEAVDSVTIDGVPDGAHLSAGTDLGGGRWALEEEDLDGLTLTPPADVFGVLDDLSVTAVSTEVDLQGTPLSSEEPFEVAVAEVNDPPELVVLESVVVQAGLDVVLGSDRLAVADPDDEPAALLFMLTDVPDAGAVQRLTGAGTWETLDLGAQFTQADVNAGGLRYVADAPEPFVNTWVDGTPDRQILREREAITPEPVLTDNFQVPERADLLTVRFEGEVASFQNTLGWYRIGDSGAPGEAQILWANASKRGDGGDLVPGGSTRTIEDIEAGDRFGLFLINDGFRAHPWLRQVDDSWTLAFDDAGNLVGSRGARVEMVRADGGFSRGNIFDAVGSSAADGIIHATSGVDALTQRLFIGFEDLTGGGDRDYNDVVVSLDFDGPSLVADEDAFSFVVTDASGAPMISDPASGYQVSPDGEATFSININEMTA